MPITHRVQQGDCLVSIAESYGFFWETLWNLPANKPIRDIRRDPTVLLAGDEVVIPERTIKDFVRPTGARHTFRVKNIPARLNLRLHDEGGRPRSGLEYVLTIDGVETTGTTDADGAVRAPVSPTARRGTLLLVASAETFTLNLGHLDPVDTVRGAQARLAQMGTYVGDVDGALNPAFVVALRSFQLSQGLSETGEMDLSTQSALREAHGG